jgi:hypothetical protein
VKQIDKNRELLAKTEMFCRLAREAGRTA